jgi:hypothetical protein
MLGAEMDAKLASLAKLLVYFDITLRAHLNAFFMIYSILSPQCGGVKYLRQGLFRN